MVDAEIYVDRIADMRINYMNTLLAATRKQILEKRNPGENNLYVRTLELVQVQEDEYFSHISAQDLAVILKDIREKHRNDTMTADEDSPVADMQRRVEEALHYEGSNDEKKARIYLAQLGIPYDKLTKEQFATLIEILNLSDFMKSPYNQRGKSKRTSSHGHGKKRKQT